MCHPPYSYSSAPVKRVCNHQLQLCRAHAIIYAVSMSSASVEYTVSLPVPGDPQVPARSHAYTLSTRQCNLGDSLLRLEPPFRHS